MPHDLPEDDIPTTPIVLALVDGRAQTYDPKTQTTKTRGPFCQYWERGDCACYEACRYLLNPYLVAVTEGPLTVLVPESSPWARALPHDQRQSPEPETSHHEVPGSKAPRITKKLRYYALREPFRDALITVIDALWKQYKRSGRTPSRVAATDREHQALWPDGLQPDRKQLGTLLRIHEIDFDALVEDRKAFLFPTGR